MQDKVQIPCLTKRIADVQKGGPWVGLINKWQQYVKYICNMPYAMYNMNAICNHMSVWHVAAAPCVDFWVVVNSPVGPRCHHKLLLKTILYLFDDGAHPNGQTYPITHIHTVYVCEHIRCCAFCLPFCSCVVKAEPHRVH